MATACIAAVSACRGARGSSVSKWGQRVFTDTCLRSMAVADTPHTLPCNRTVSLTCSILFALGEPQLAHSRARGSAGSGAMYTYIFGAFGAVSVTLTRHHKQLTCLTLRVSHWVWIQPEEWLSTAELQSKRSNPFWCIWCSIFIPHEPPLAAVLLNTKGLPSGLDRTRGVVEH